LVVWAWLGSTPQKVCVNDIKEFHTGVLGMAIGVNCS